MFSQEHGSGDVRGEGGDWLSAMAPPPASAPPPPNPLAEEGKVEPAESFLTEAVVEPSSPSDENTNGKTQLANNTAGASTPFDIFEQGEGPKTQESITSSSTQPVNSDLDIFGSTTEVPSATDNAVFAADTLGATEKTTNIIPAAPENDDPQSHALIPSSTPAADPFSLFEASSTLVVNGGNPLPVPSPFHPTPSHAQTTGYALDIFDSKATSNQQLNIPQAPTTSHELDIFDQKPVPGTNTASAPQPVQHQETSAELVAIGPGNNYSLEDDIFGLNLGPTKPRQEEPQSSTSRRTYESRLPESPIRNSAPSESSPSRQSSSPSTRTRRGPNGRSATSSSNDHPEDPQTPGMPKDVDPKQVAYAKRLENQAYDLPPDASPLPDAEAILGSGHILSRISLRTIITKKWKQSYWVQYGSTQILLFRSVGDYQDWLTNPYHSQKVRNFLIKESIDFVEELQRPNVVGFQMTRPAMKSYERGDPMMWHFKLEKWMDYGATIAAAFASPNPRELEELRKACASCIRASRRGGGGMVVDRIAPASPRRHAADDSSAVANCL